MRAIMRNLGPDRRYGRAVCAIALVATICAAAIAQDPGRERSGDRDSEARELYERAAGSTSNNMLEQSLALLEQAFAKDSGLSDDVLSDARFEALLDDDDSRAKLRELLRRHAVESSIAIAREDEPGERIIVSGAVRNGAGEPIAGALIYIYHTDERGIYSAQGDRNPRLFGYMRTDQEGRYEYRTIRPASYPNTRVDQHVHYELSAEGYRSRNWRLGFSDDPYWEGRSIPRWVAKPQDEKSEDDDATRFTCDIVLERS